VHVISMNSRNQVMCMWSQWIQEIK